MIPGNRVLVLGLVLGASPVVILTIAGLVRVTPVPEIELTSNGPAIGRRGTVSVYASEISRGLSAIKVELIQGDRSRVLEEHEFERGSPWKIWWRGEPKYANDLEIGKDELGDLEEGEVIIRATATGQGAWLRTPKSGRQELKLTARFTPPKITPGNNYISVAQGGCELVTYEVGENIVRDGVEIRDWFFKGHPIPGGKKTQRFVLFGVPYDLEEDKGIKLVAEDELGNVGELTGFIHKFIPRPIGSDTINLSTELLDKTTGEILTHSQNSTVEPNASLVDKFKAVNGEMRKRHLRFLRQLAEESRDQFLWRDKFIPLPGTVVKGLFADRRTYRYQGKHIDTQDHLGIDLASVERAPIPAANSGVVLFANYLGIFGNAVVIDHGYGLMSLYAHLSKTDVKVGDEVTRGDIIGNTGNTGLSGGDHLHFTMLIEGMAVTPIEWWDPRWISEHIRAKLGRALPQE